MPSEIIVEFPSPLTDKEKKMIYGYKGEVVRCKDCKHFSKYLSEEKADGVCWHNNADYEVTCNHFCSWGKRR